MAKKKINVKRVLILIGVAIIIALIFSRPWRLIAVGNNEDRSSEIVAITPIPLNKIVQNADSDIPEAANFDKAVNSFMRQWDITGASLAIMKDGNLIYSKGYGYANKEEGDSTEVKHIFRLASVSKLITATAIMKLCESGVISLQSKVFGKEGILKSYIGYVDKRFEKITIEHLLRHQAGFTIRSGDPMFDQHKLEIPLPITSDRMISYVLRRGLGYNPGDRCKYSNVGYLILSEVIGTVTKMPYEKYVKDSILTPIGCLDMHIGHSSKSERYPNEVSYYEDGDAELIPAYDGTNRMVRKSEGGNNIALLSGAGGWVSSPVELLRFVAAIDYNNTHQKILSKESVEKMTTPKKGAMPIGWSNVNDKGDWFRSGSMAGTSAMMRRQDNGYTWVFITNTSSWKGAHFPKMINAMMRNAFGRVTNWPEKDMFQFDSIQ